MRAFGRGVVINPASQTARDSSSSESDCHGDDLALQDADDDGSTLTRGLSANAQPMAGEVLSKESVR
jgi:hypothetical protein